MISNEDIKYYLFLNILICEYNKKLRLNKNETLSNFLKNSNLDELLNESKAVLLSLKEDNETVYFFLNKEDNDLQVVIAFNDRLKKIIVIFRGTTCYRDWYYNLNFCQIEIEDNIFVHKGFYKKLKSEGSFNNINNILFSLLHYKSDYDLYLTGYSSGGALALLYGYLIRDKINKRINIITFGSPRLGNKNFRDEFDKCENLYHYRVTNCRDIVTAVPFYNYSHVGINYNMEIGKVTIYKNYSYNMWFTFSLLNCWNLYDHDIISYYKTIITVL